MEKNINQKHSKETLYFSISMMLERASYYGFRILLILYMTGEIIKMDRTEALSIFGWFAGSLMVSKIIGALLGDLVIGNRKTFLLGGIIQALGTFCLCIPSTTGLYLGLFLVVLGNGFYTPNMTANFGKLYLNKTKLLDSGFTIFYLAINLGAFFGTSFIGIIGERYGYNFGFILAGILMLFSLIPLLITKEKVMEKEKKHDLSINRKILNISIVLIVVGLFWAIYEISYIRISDIQADFNEISKIEILKSNWYSINSYLILPIGIIAIIVWTYFYSLQFFKLMLGFIFGVISIGILLLIPEVPTEEHTVVYLISILFMAISEIHIAPIVHSILTKYSNPKYLAIFISLAFLPIWLISLGFGLFNDKFYENPTLGLKFGILAMIIIGIGLFGYIVWNKKVTTTLYKRNSG